MKTKQTHAAAAELLLRERGEIIVRLLRQHGRVAGADRIEAWLLDDLEFRPWFPSVGDHVTEWNGKTILTIVDARYEPDGSVSAQVEPYPPGFWLRCECLRPALMSAVTETETCSGRP